MGKGGLILGPEHGETIPQLPSQLKLVWFTIEESWSASFRFVDLTAKDPSRNESKIVV